MIQGIARANSEINLVRNTVKQFEYVKSLIKNMGLRDTKIESPDENAIKLLFDDYGKEAYDHMTNFIQKWIEKRLWN